MMRYVVFACIALFAMAAAVDERSSDLYDAQPPEEDSGFFRAFRSSAGGKPTFIRFGKRAQPNFIRFGRAQPSFIRFGRADAMH